MMALGWVILRRHPHIPMSQAAPLLRLLLLAIGVMAIAGADRFVAIRTGIVPGHWLGFAAVLFGIALIALTIRVDRKARHKLFPSAFPGIRHPASLGIWGVEPDGAVRGPPSMSMAPTSCRSIAG